MQGHWACFFIPGDLDLDIQTCPSEEPNTSSLWIWCKSVQQFQRYLMHKQKKLKNSQTALKTEPYLHAVITTCSINSEFKCYELLEYKMYTRICLQSLIYVNLIKRIFMPKFAAVWSNVIYLEPTKATNVKGGGGWALLDVVSQDWLYLWMCGIQHSLVRDR